MKRKSNILILFSCLIFYSSNITGQSINCGTSYFESLMNLNDPNYALRRQQIQTGINDSIRSRHLDSLRSRGSVQWGVKRIPVVFHLIGDVVTTDPAFSLANIQLRVQKLNQDYRKMANTPGEGDGVDTEIEFCLAQKDENGNNTTGIVSTIGSYGPYCVSDDATIKTLSHWDPSKYLNIWICNLTNCTEKAWGSDPAMYFTNSNTSLKFRDGVVCDMSFFNTRILTHEVGHWLNLKHLCSNTQNVCTYDDDCADTPFCFGSSGSNLGNNCLAPNQCTTQNNNSSSTRLVHNYMDDADDGCKNMFTVDQTTKMQLTLSNIRGGLLQNSIAGCGSTAPSCYDGIPNGNETGVDCGGSCPPCATSPVNCSTIDFKINGKTTNWWDIVNVCDVYGSIILSPYSSTPGCETTSTFKTTMVKKEGLDYTDPEASDCYHDSNYAWWREKYRCWYQMIHVSIQECDKNRNLIGPELGNWFNVSHSNISTINLHDYLYHLGNPLSSGKYFRIKLSGGGGNNSWFSHSGFIKVFESNVNIVNESISNSQVGDNIVLNGCTVSSPINIVASNKIDIINSSALTSGSYFINTIDCSNISTFRGSNNSLRNQTNNLNTFNSSISKHSAENKELVKKYDKVFIIPNPNNGNFTITTDDKEGNLKSIEIQNALGIIVQNIMSPSNSTEINIQNQPSGLYLVKLNFADKTVTKKMIKQ
ncbi:MAG: zinc-dependent metalloprotease [Bacteroidia bacterium]|nr:zinc-dependent metalloprotease [Bacteroidia bacterium]